MIKKRRKKLVHFYILGDFTAIILAFAVAFWVRFYSGIAAVPKGIPSFSKYLVIIPILIFVHVVHFSYQGYYKIRLRRNRLDDLFLVFLNTIVSAFLIVLIFSYLKSYRFTDFEVSRFYLLVYIPFGMFFIFFFRQVMFKFFSSIYLKRNGVSKVLVAGTGDFALMTAENLRKYSHFGIEITGFLGDKEKNEEKEGVTILGHYDELQAVVRKHNITDLLIALPSKEYETTLKLIETANNLLIEIRLVPDILQIASLKAGIEHIEGVPVINLGDIPLQGWQVVFKRAFDLFVSTVGLVLISPFLAVVALLIKLTSRGPVFYSQTRVGLDGKHFKMIKFRTMISNAEKETGVIWSPPNDHRITKIGRILIFGA